MKETYSNYSHGRIIKRRNNIHTDIKELTSEQMPTNPSEQFLSNMDNYLGINQEQLSDSNYEKHNAWAQIIKNAGPLNAGPYTHIFTLSFIHAYNDKQAIAAITRWCAMMNRNIFGPRWKKNGKGLSGVVVAERHVVSHAFRKRLHFHVLINIQSNELPTSDLYAIATKCAMSLKNQSGNKMTAHERIDLSEVYDEDGIINYLLKDKNNPLLGTNGENIGFWKPRMGFTGFAFTPKTSAELVRMH